MCQQSLHRGLTASIARQETKSVPQHRRGETQLVDVECGCGRETLVDVDTSSECLVVLIHRMFDFLPSRCHVSSIQTSTVLPTTIIACHYSGQPWPMSATTWQILAHAALDCLFYLHMQVLSTLGPQQLPPCWYGLNQFNRIKIRFLRF